MPTSDLLLKIVCRTLAVGSAAIVMLILIFLIGESWPAWQSPGIAQFFLDESWHPSSGQYNLTPMIAATLITSAGAMLLAAPLGIASAVFVQFYAPGPLAVWHRRLVELLAGIPSVVFGLWGLVVLAPLIAALGGSGQNLLTASIILGLMILPTIALLADAAIGSVPPVWIQGAAALGLQRSAIVLRVVLPAAGRGIGSALVLAITRALGETMAVLMVAGNTVQMPTSLLSPGRTLNANIALELGYATADHRPVLFVSGLMLMVIVGVLVVAISREGGRRYA